MQNYFKFDIDKALLLGYNIKAVKQRADIAQSVECILGKDEVTGSNPVISSNKELQLKVCSSFCFYMKLQRI